MSKQTKVILIGLSGIALIVTLILLFGAGSSHNDDFSNMLPIYIAVIIATSSRSSNETCRHWFWRKKEQDK